MRLQLAFETQFALDLAHSRLQILLVQLKDVIHLLQHLVHQVLLVGWQNVAFAVLI